MKTRTAELPQRIRPRSLKRTVLLAVQRDGSFRAADYASSVALRSRGFTVGDEVSAELKKPRNAHAWRRAHALGTALIENTDDFESYEDSHAVLKRLQLETGVGCDTILFKVPGVGLIEQRIPLTLAFETMDDGEFNAIYARFARHVIDTYWQGFTPDQVEQTASLVGRAA